MDLPEPKRVPLTPEEKNRQRWSILVAFTWLMTAYVVLHKGIIPLVLKFTPLSTSLYARIDPWFFLPVFLLQSLLRYREMAPVTCFWAGSGIAYGALELYSVLKGQHQGWLIISHTLSSVPITILSIAFLSGPFPKRKTELAWVGALVTFIIQWGERYYGV